MTAKTMTKKAEAKKAETKTVEKKGWRVKKYYLDAKAYAAAEGVEKLPNQVKILLRHFSENFNDPKKAAVGRELCQSAIDDGGLQTRIEPHILFAYYIRRMEKFGMMGA